MTKYEAQQTPRIGCKGKKKYWYGYKKHVSVDMKNGLINKVAVTAANETDAQGLERVCPNQGTVIGDKAIALILQLRQLRKKVVMMLPLRRIICFAKIEIKIGF